MPVTKRTAENLSEVPQSKKLILPLFYIFSSTLIKQVFKIIFLRCQIHLHISFWIYFTSGNTLNTIHVPCSLLSQHRPTLRVFCQLLHIPFYAGTVSPTCFGRHFQSSSGANIQKSTQHAICPWMASHTLTAFMFMNPQACGYCYNTSK